MSPSSSDQNDPSDVVYRGCLISGGAAFALLCAGLSTWAIWLLVTAGFSLANLAIAIFFGLFTLVGLFLSWKGARHAGKTPVRRMLEESAHRTVLRLAKQEGGRLTLGEVTLETRLQPAEAEEVLQELELHRIAELRVTESGREVYDFPAFLEGDNDHEEARAVLEEDDEVALLLEEFD
ncbi:MAG: hypothetical protein ACOCV2_01385, partial [Persicimonas sp.]